MDRILWYLQKSWNLLIVCTQISLHCLFHPKEFFKLFFLLFSQINEFYQSSHGRLINFNQTQTFQRISQETVFAQSNVFNLDSKVTRPMETQILAALVSYFQPAAMFEIGTYNGFTALHFAVNSPAKAVIYTLDLPPDFNPNEKNQFSYDDLLVVKLSMEHIHARIYRQHPCREKIKELFGDSLNFDFSPYYGKMDLVFIDGNHSHNYVQRDTQNAFKMLNETGIIVWHDYDYIVHKEVFNYLNTLSKEYKIYFIPHTRFAIYGKNLK